MFSDTGTTPHSVRLLNHNSPQRMRINATIPVPPFCSAERCDIYNDGASGTGCRSDTSRSTASDPGGKKEK